MDSAQQFHQAANKTKNWHGALVSGCLKAALWSAAFIFLCFITLMMRLSYGPLSTQALTMPLARTLSDELAPGWSSRIAETGIALTAHGPALLAQDIEIIQPDGSLFLRASSGEITLSPWSLLTGRVDLTSIRFTGIAARLVTTPEGIIYPVSTTPVPEALDAENAFEKAIISIADLLSDQSGLTRALARITLADVKVSLIDPSGTEKLALNDIAADLVRKSPDKLAISIELNGSANRWAIRGDIIGLETQEKTINLAVDSLPFQDILLLTGAEEAPFEGDLKFSAQTTIAISADKKLARFSGSLESSPGTLIYHDKDQPPFNISTLKVQTEYEPDNDIFRITSLNLQTNGAHFDLAGQLLFHDPTLNWTLNLSGRDVILPALSDQEAPLTIDTLTLQASSFSKENSKGTSKEGGIIIERFAVAGAGFGLALNGELGGPDNTGGIRLGLRTARSSARTLLHFWPKFVAPETRQYLVENLADGIIESLEVAVDLSQADLEASRYHKPLPQQSILVHFGASDVTLTAAPGFPPLEKAKISGTVTGNNATLEIPQSTVEVAANESLHLSAGDMMIKSLTAPIDADIRFHLQGSNTALAKLLQRDALKAKFNFDLKPEALKGTANLDISLALPLIKDLKADQVITRASGKLDNLAIDLEDIKLTDTGLSLKLDSKNLSLSGHGLLMDVPAEFALRLPLRKESGQPQIDVTLTLDEKTREAQGLNLGSRLKGPVTARITAPFNTAPRKSPSPMKVEVDLKAAHIDNLLPGWIKKSGQAGKIRFSLLNNKGYALSNIAIEAGNFFARGTAQFEENRTLMRADLTHIRFSENDDFSLALTQSHGHYHLSAQGKRIDARPFLKFLRERDNTTHQTRSSSPEPINVDVKIATDIMTGFNNEVVSNAHLALTLRDGEPETLTLIGSFNGAPITVVTDKNDSKKLTLETGNAGSVLRFTDIYAYMGGGTMRMQIDLNKGGEGKVIIHDFAIHNEPTMKRVLTENQNKFSANPSHVSFTKLKASFTHVGGYINIPEGVMWGPSVGVTIGGSIDTVRDYIDVSGTYVPAYAINNIFSQIPLVGPLLGGGQYGGLFAVNFRAVGKVDSPSVTINPLSAIAPGIFRKFFDF